MKAVFVGQSPNRVEDEGDPLTLRDASTSGSRLMKWMGVTHKEFADNFVRVNLNPHYDGDEFSPVHFRASALNMRGLLEGRRVVLLGRAVAESFCLTASQYHYHRWFDHPEFEKFGHTLFAVVPHPSGLNRLYNQQEHINGVSHILRGLWTFAQEATNADILRKSRQVGS